MAQHYVLMQELRLHAARTACARTQVMWLRDRLLKLSVHVVSSVRRLVLHLPRSTPNLDAWRKIAPFPRRARRVTRPTRVWTRVHGRHHGEAVFGQPSMTLIVRRIAARPRHRRSPA